MQLTTDLSSLPASGDESVLVLLRELLSDYVDLTGKTVDASTELAQLEVDSLTLAEVLFALEDKLGMSMAEPTTLPVTVGDLMAFLKPYLGRLPNGLH